MVANTREAVLELRRLRIKRGDVVVLKLPPTCTARDVREVCDLVRPAAASLGAVALLPLCWDVELSTLDDEALRAAGLRRMVQG